MPLTKINVQNVVQKSQVPESKNWPTILRCFSFPAVDMEDPSTTQKIQFLSESWLETEQNSHWWRLGMRLIRCCKAQDVETVQRLMMNVAKYNHSGKPSITKLVLSSCNYYF